MAPVDPNLYRSASKASYLDGADEVLSPQFEKLYRAAKRRAKKADIPFELTRRELSALVGYAGGKCSYTNILFSEESVALLRYRPYAPSIDRYDSGRIYSFKNCFLVCAMVNMAKGAKSISLMHLMMLDYAAAHGALLPERLFNSDPADHWKY